MKKNGILFITSAPSGSGKTTLCSKLVESVDGLYRSISMTTRPPRPGEKDGIDYIFIEKNEFMKRQKKNEFLEWAKVFGEYYGTPKKHILHMLERGSDVLLSIDVQGAMKIKRLRLDGVYIFIMPPSLAMLRERLINCSTDSTKAISERLSVAKKEVACSGRYDYIVVNNRLETALDNLRAIIIAERCRIKRGHN
jgi:guanylate kinase